MELLSRKPTMIADPVGIESCHSDMHRKWLIRHYQGVDRTTDVISARFGGSVFEMGEV